MISLDLRDDDEAWASRMEKMAEMHMEWVEKYGWRCRDCGTKWNPQLHPATRTDPAYVDIEECPLCGGPPQDG